MRAVIGRPAALIILIALSSACSGSRSVRGAAHADPSLITAEQILEHRFNNAYEAVEALHHNWLQTKGTDSFSNPTEIWVYVDQTRLGGIATLKSISVATIRSIRHFDGVSATARWGIDHGQGVILVTTK